LHPRTKWLARQMAKWWIRMAAKPGLVHTQAHTGRREAVRKLTGVEQATLRPEYILEIGGYDIRGGFETLEVQIDPWWSLD